MNDLKANISSILNSSFIDGPGNRMVIFFQGCQFDCIYCHNPHTIGLCNRCGVCSDNCPTQSLQIVGSEFQHNKQTCTSCDKCIINCPQNSSPFYKQYSVKELINKVRENADFISGITLSGGEVMLQVDFLTSFITTLKSDAELKHLTVFIDSNGGVPLTSIKKVAPLADGFLIDLKAASDITHFKITGKPIDDVLNTIKFLISIDKLYEIRSVVVKGVNDIEKELFLDLYKTLPTETNIKLIKMRKHGIRDRFTYLEELSDSEMLKVVRFYEINGVEVEVV